MNEVDAEIGLLALEKGLVKQQDIDDCLARLGEDDARTLPKTLLDRSLLTSAQMESLKAEAVRRIQERNPGFVLPAAPAAPESARKDSIHEAMEAQQDPRNRFGKYVRVREVGKIGSGQIWKARDFENNRWVLLKIFKSVGGSQGTDRFLQQAKSWMALSDPGIVPIYDVGRQEEDGAERAYIVLEYVRGETLDRHRERGITPRRAAEIARDAARAVGVAHEKGVLHRNLKPRNIMVTGDGRVRVMDFGLASLAATLTPDDDSMLSRTIQVQGTPGYMPPEQALGRTHDIRERSDVYSLGAVLYFLLTGRAPFDAGSAVKTCFAVVRDPLVPPSRHNPEAPPDLERVIFRAMAKDPVRRYESARALAADLERFLQGAPVLTDDQMRFTQGLAALHQGRLEEAIYMFKELIRMEKPGAAGLPGHEIVLKQLAEGENGLSLAIQQQSKNYDIRTNRGVYRFARALIQSLMGIDPSASGKAAMEDFVVAAELRSEYTLARVNRANVLIFGGRYARDTGKDVTSIFRMSLQDLDAAIEFDNTFSSAYHNRGIVNFYMAKAVRKGDDPEPFYRKSIEDFSRAAELEPTYGYIFKDLGVVKVALAKHLMGQGQKVKSLFVEAVNHLDMACGLNPALYGAFYERGQAHFALKNFRQAVKDFNRCLELDPARDQRVKALIDEAERHLQRGTDMIK